MLEIKRKLMGTVSIKTMQNATRAAYNISFDAINNLFNLFKLETAATKNAYIAHEIQNETKWLEKWRNQLDNGPYVKKDDHYEVKSEILFEESNDFELYTDHCNIDLFNANLMSKIDKIPETDYDKLFTVVSRGIENNFRFYSRPNCNIIVLDYRAIIDYIAFWYSFRELGYRVDQVEGALKPCSTNNLNHIDNLRTLVNSCVGGFCPNKFESNEFIRKSEKTVLNDNGNMRNLTAELRVSTTACYQYVPGTKEVKTWLQKTIKYQPKMLYKSILTACEREILWNIVNRIAGEIESNSAFNNTKIICADNCCVALSIPDSIDNTTIHTAFDVLLRLFNRYFIVPCTILQYKPQLDVFTEEEVENGNN